MSVYTASLGLPPLNGTLVLAVFNLASVVGKFTTALPPRVCQQAHPSPAGQIGFGHVCDIAPYAYVMIVSGAGAALSAYLLWGFAHSLGLIFAFVVVFGSLVRVSRIQVYASQVDFFFGWDDHRVVDSLPFGQRRAQKSQDPNKIRCLISSDVLVWSRGLPLSLVRSSLHRCIVRKRLPQRVRTVGTDSGRSHYLWAA